MTGFPASAELPRPEGAVRASAERPGRGALIVNADDWGRDAANTDRSLDCVLAGTVSSVSAMVWMEDSERGADLARRHGVDAGLHLNLTSPFTAAHCPRRVSECQAKLSRYLNWHRLAQIVYHPGLAPTFAYVVQSQLDEYERLYGFAARRIDGHHHMHLCANVMGQKLLPEGTIARRNFSFRHREKSLLNRLYRRWQDRRLGRRHRLADYLFTLLPGDAARLAEIAGIARRFAVEVETHPVIAVEYRFLMSGGLMHYILGTEVERGYLLRDM